MRATQLGTTGQRTSRIGLARLDAAMPAEAVARERCNPVQMTDLDSELR
jgi:hypothetical protein